MMLRARRKVRTALVLLCAVSAVTCAATRARAQATPDQLDVPPGFKIELVLKADKQKHGSWISMAKDRKGRLLLGAQRGQPITRLTLADGKVNKEEQLKLPVSEAM